MFIYSVARLSLAANKKSELSESRRLSAYQAAEPRNGFIAIDIFE
jgi:hypothetical protein